MKDWVDSVTIERIEGGFVIAVFSDMTHPGTTKHFVKTNHDVADFVFGALESEAQFQRPAERPDPEPVPA